MRGNHLDQVDGCINSQKVLKVDEVASSEQYDQWSEECACGDIKTHTPSLYLQPSLQTGTVLMRTLNFD